MMTLEQISKALRPLRWDVVKQDVNISWNTFNKLRSGNPSVMYESIKKMSDYLEGVDDE